MKKTIVIGSDHGGFALKQALIEALAAWGHPVEDQGPDCADSCDYPVFAARVAERIKADKDALGVLICGTGQGMTMAANRLGVRAALCTNEFLARMAREHNDARVLCLGERVTGQGLALAILKTFLETGFGGGRHQRRIDLMDATSE
ncbi:ribose 5-phosphate isomerase B [Pseudodesulfovibrio sp. F-1]|uniref:Ribose 5-phosphate isomerase B n=1 Tax=Pseudodesulfovibrio alkaliphilus TaxID=2661613 RepID=A0A7K1KN19_9BACT|nr:ribose 5-phosphate isomerase B [Pseudodesulfovibrio alkaliphilus]